MAFPGNGVALCPVEPTRRVFSELTWLSWVIMTLRKGTTSV